MRVPIKVPTSVVWVLTSGATCVTCGFCDSAECQYKVEAQHLINR